ncbi:MAG: tryptophan 2,3-dioxygenase, partial [Bacteroidetes bacterium]|nr:tryptophan 2,3-dioxygenase [Bacteroidota bacterium]
KKTLTLKQFEEKYSSIFIKKAKYFRNCNLGQIYENKFSNTKLGKEIKSLLKRYDALVNISWKLAHYKSAVRYLHKDPVDIAATGGTNWQKYLPPRFQKIIFYPSLWTKKEKENWGKTWVMKEVYHMD